MRVLAISLILCLQACAHSPDKSLPTAENVDLERFMGDWYVIANIPTFIEKGAHNAVESYAMNEDGSIATTFRFNADSFNGEIKEYNPTGYVSADSNSVWGMQFIWPFKAEFVIAYLSPDYQHTIIARSARDYVWVMSRSAEIDEKTYDELINLCVAMGYQKELIEKIPHNSKQRSNTMELM